MTSIVRKLRDPDPNWTADNISSLVLEAADELERLGRCNEQLSTSHAEQLNAAIARNARLRNGIALVIGRFDNAPLSDTWWMGEPMNCTVLEFLHQLIQD